MSDKKMTSKHVSTRQNCNK